MADAPAPAADAEGHGGAWNVEIDESELTALTAGLRNLRDGLGEGHRQTDSTDGCAAELTRCGFGSGTALRGLMSRHTQRMHHLRVDCDGVVDNIDRVQVDFADVETAARAAVTSVGDALRDSMSGVGRLVGFEPRAYEGIPEPTPVEHPPSDHHVKGLYP